MRKLIFLLLSLFTLGFAAEYDVIEDRANVPILSPDFSQRKTEKIRLSNGLEAYLISDPASKKSGAALSVSTGSWEDPESFPGLAHFLEHMLFMGTEKYPDESEYQRFIAENGGLTNAFTTNDATSYLYTVENDAFEGALDRFADFFKTPLFNPSGVERELNAIDQEYAKNLDNDEIRKLFVLKALTDPRHPNHRFNMGNSATLKDVSQETLKKFYQNHYSADRMKLIVISTLPLKDLVPLVAKEFSEVPERETVTTIPDLPATLQDQNSYIFIEPIKNNRTLTLAWNLPPKFAELQEEKPEDLVCYILGDEGENSLHAQLKREKLAEGVKCGGVRFGPGLMTLYLEVDLTQKGLREVDLVIERVFQNLASLREEGIPEYIFRDVKQIATLQYQYQSRENEFYHLMKHAMQLPYEPIATYPMQSKIITKYDPPSIQEMLSYLTPKNAAILITAQGSKSNLKEKWLGVPYRMEPIPESRLQMWASASPHPGIKLPQPNPFIPKDLSLKSTQTTRGQSIIPKPNQTLDFPIGKLYLVNDTTFQTPKISWHFYFKTPLIQNGDSESVVMADLFLKAVKDQLNSITYPASVADLDFSLERKENGIALQISGYSEKAFELLGRILEALKSSDISQDRFAIYKEALIRKYQNFSKESSLKVGAEKFRSILYQNYTTEQEKAVAIRKINLKKFRHFSENLFRKLFIEALLYGNQSDQEGTAVQAALQSQFDAAPYPEEEQLTIDTVVLPDDSGPFFIEAKSEAQGNSAILAIESYPFSFEKRAAQQILMQGIKELFFDTLRTKQQTGYIVLSYPEEVEKKLFLLFAVQSNSHGARDLLSRFELFLEESLQKLPQETITKTQFENIRRAAFAELLHPAKNVNEMGKILNELAFEYEADFQWYQKRAEALKSLSYEQFLKLSSEMIGKSNRRRIGILINGKMTNGNAFDYERVSGAKLKRISQYKAFGSGDDQM